MELSRLGLIELSEAKERLINTLFRLHRVEPSFIWTTSPEGPFDALLVDSEVDPISTHMQMQMQMPGDSVPW